MAPGSLLAARLRQYCEWLLGIHRGCTELSGGLALRRPLGVLHGVAGTACRPRERRRGEDVCVEGYDSGVVTGTEWRASWRRRGSLGGALTGGTWSSR